MNITTPSRVSVSYFDGYNEYPHHQASALYAGTVIAFSGQMLEHGVSQVEGERGVLSYYMQDNIHEYIDVSCCNYMKYAMWGG